MLPRYFHVHVNKCSQANSIHPLSNLISLFAVTIFILYFNKATILKFIDTLQSTMIAENLLIQRLHLIEVAIQQLQKLACIPVVPLTPPMGKYGEDGRHGGYRPWISGRS